MNIGNRFCAVFGLAWLLGGAWAAVDGAPLFGADSAVAESALDAGEAKHIAAFKAEPERYKNLKVVRLSPALLDSSRLITVVTPDGKLLQFAGSKKAPPAETLPFFADGKRHDMPYPSAWVGRSNTGIFTASYLPGGFSASFSDEGRQYSVQGLGTSNRYFVLMETPVIWGPAEPTGLTLRQLREMAASAPSMKASK